MIRLFPLPRVAPGLALIRFFWQLAMGLAARRSRHPRKEIQSFIARSFPSPGQSKKLQT